MSEVKLKLVRAKRTGSSYGHRRRAGSTFVVPAEGPGSSEIWFEDVGPAPEGSELPVQITNAQAPQRKTFIGVMKDLGRQDIDVVLPVIEEPQTLGQVELPASNAEI